MAVPVPLGGRVMVRAAAGEGEVRLVEVSDREAVEVGVTLVVAVAVVRMAEKEGEEETLAAPVGEAEEVEV